MKKKIIKISLVVITVCFIGICIKVLYIIYSIGANMCSDDTVEELLSPDHEMKAVIYCRDCGATTSFSTHVDIVPTSKTFFSKDGHIFSADASRVKAQLLSCGGPKVEALWKDKDTLIIRYDKNSKIHKSLDEFKNINILYVAN